MNSNELLSGAAPEFGGFLEKLTEYGQGSCFGCGGTVSTYKETGTGRILDHCPACGEVVQSPRMVGGKLQDGFAPGTAPPDEPEKLF